MSRKLIKDLGRDKTIYQLSDDLHGSQLGEYYFLIDEEKLLRGHSQDYHFDENGIPIIPSYVDVAEKQMIYYPISIGQYGLAIFHTWMKSGKEEDKVRFLNIVNWFYDHRVTDEKGVYWLSTVPKPEYHMTQPWPSAFAQSRGLSILLRGWQISGEIRYRDAAVAALKIFDIPAVEGGVVTATDYGPFYEEYPTVFPTMVLDGFIFSLCGLYDAVRALNDDSARRLYRAGIDSLKRWLPHYDLGFWMRYNYCRESFYPDTDPATIGYLRLVITQLNLLARLTGETELARAADHFRSYDKWPNIVRMYALKFRALRRMNRL